MLFACLEVLRGYRVHIYILAVVKKCRQIDLFGIVLTTVICNVEWKAGCLYYKMLFYKPHQDLLSIFLSAQAQLEHVQIPWK